jgi:hypothetical protein
MITKKSLVLGLVVLALLAAIPTLYDNVTTSLSGMTQTIVGNKTFDSKQTRFLDSSSSTKVSLSNANPANTTTLIVSSAKLNSTTVILSAPSTPAPSPGPQVIANITFRDPTLGGTIDGIAGGESQDGKGNYGGYILLNTTRFGVSGNQLEAVQAVPNGHVGMPQDITSYAVRTPNGCAALATCATYAPPSFTYPYVNYNGGAAEPTCYAPSIQDITAPKTIWVGNVSTVSSTAVTYNYAPLTATTGVHNLKLTSTCHESGY